MNWDQIEGSWKHTELPERKPNVRSKSLRERTSPQPGRDDPNRIASGSLRSRSSFLPNFLRSLPVVTQGEFIEPRLNKL